MKFSYWEFWNIERVAERYRLRSKDWFLITRDYAVSLEIWLILGISNACHSACFAVADLKFGLWVTDIVKNKKFIWHQRTRLDDTSIFQYVFKM